MEINQTFINQTIEEIQDTGEVNRRALAKRRHDIYLDGGKPFLIEKILKEFGQDALSEMRLIPINLLKKLVDKRAGVYRRPPVRSTEEKSDQLLVDYYVRELCWNEVMQKANRYLVLSSNTVVYIVPESDGCLKACVVPSYQYSIVPDAFEPTEPEVFIFSSYVDEGRITPQANQYPATGVESYSEERSPKTKPNLVNSNEKETDSIASRFIFWSEESHVTTNENGSPFMDPEKGPEQFINPIGMLPVINVARDRDSTVWATQGEDMVDLTMALQMGWSDVMTIAKHQGFSILTITSEEEPKKLSIGVNRAVWLKTNAAGGPQPSIGYVQGNSPLAEYKELLTELLGLLLTTNNMDPNSISGSAKPVSVNSGFHALLTMADSLEAIESDKPLMMKVEKESWEVIKAWHNWMFDVGMLDEEAKALGKFSEEFTINIQFADIKPLESEDERIKRVKELMDMGLLTREDALRKLHPELKEDEIKKKLIAIDAEKSDNLNKAQKMIGGSYAVEDGDEQEDVQQESQDGAQDGETS